MLHIETINEAGRQLAARIEEAALQVDGDAIVFIGALGICVRRILPHVHDKYTDPAVVCIDTTGRYVIPVLSGHVGGANQLASQLASLLGAEAVITTQSDNAGLWPLDTLARSNGWGQGDLSRQEMNAAIAAFVNRRPTALVVEHEDAGTRQMEISLPAHVTLFRSYEAFAAADGEDGHTFELLITVSPRILPSAGIMAIHYYPRCLHLGVGCQRMTPTPVAMMLLNGIRAKGLALESIATINTIELKKDEPVLESLSGVLYWASKNIFTAGTLASIPVPNPSDKVFEVTGCYGVAEASAIASARAVHAAPASAAAPVLVVEKQKGSFTVGSETYHYTFAVAQSSPSARRGHIEIVGAGPGDPELISVRGRRFLEQADLILYAGSLVPRELTFCAKAGATVRSSADMDLEEQFRLMKDFYDRGLLVVRLHTGDPCIYGAIQEQMAFFDDCGMDYHITPGISSFLAAAAELRSQFTIPERCQTIILTRGEGQTPMPEREQLRLLAEHRSTMCIFLSASLAGQVQAELLAGGYPPETPVAACYKLTWKEQRICRGQLKDLASIIRDNHFTLTTMIVVGDAIDNREGLSKLYDSHFTHLFRKGKE